MLKQDILREATRLTQAGQLVEATALIQRMLRGDNAPGAKIRIADRIAIGKPSVIDAKVNTVEDSSQPSPAKSARPRRLRESLDRMGEGAGLGFRGAIKRAPLSTQDIVPKGARFIEENHSNPAGSRSYKLFIPSGYHGQPLPLVIMLHGCTQSAG
jgi:hypothetical protein